MADTFYIKGLADLQKFLSTLPVKMEKNIMRGALRAGTNVIKEEAKAKCPVAQPSRKNKREYGAYAGQLRDSLQVTTRTKGGMVYAKLKAGGKSKSGVAFYAHMVEFGTKSHWNNKAKTKWHPGATPKPFMRPAFDGQSKNAVIAAGNYIKNRLESKHGLDTADIQIGDE